MQPSRMFQDMAGEELSRSERIRMSLFTIASVIGAIVLFGFVIVALRNVGDAVATFLLSMFLVFCLREPVAWLEQRGVSRGIGSLLSLLGLFAILALIAIIVLPTIISQFVTLVQQTPSYVNGIIEWINSLAGKYGERFSSPQASAQLDRIISVMSDRLASFATRSANGIISFTVSASSATVVLFMSIIASFWFLRDLPRMSREVNVLVSPKRSDEFHTVVGICSRVAGGYIKGVLISSLITGVVSSIGFSLIGLPYAVILGTITGIMNVIPIVGPWVAGAIAAIVALFVSPLICFLSIVITVAVRFLVDSVVQPRVMSSTVNLHPGVVIIALMVGGGVAGPAGMVMAVPVTAVIKDVFAYEFERRTGRQVLGEDGALFKGRSLLEAEDSGGPDGDDVVEAPDAPDDSSSSSVPDEPGTLMGAPDEDVTPES